MYTLYSIVDIAMREFDVKYIRVYENKGKVTFQFKKKDYKRITEEMQKKFEYKCRPAGVYFTYEGESKWNAIINTAFGTCLTNAVRTVKKGLMKLLRMS